MIFAQIVISYDSSDDAKWLQDIITMIPPNQNFGLWFHKRFFQTLKHQGYDSCAWQNHKMT